MDLQTNVYRIETLHQFDIKNAEELIRMFKGELDLLTQDRPKAHFEQSESQTIARIDWLSNMISVLETNLTSRIESIRSLEDQCRKAPEFLNDAEMKVFLASLGSKKSYQQIADEVGYTEGYVRILRHQINKKLGFRFVKF